jgi:hypothetical protein
MKMPSARPSSRPRGCHPQYISPAPAAIMPRGTNIRRADRTGTGLPFSEGRAFTQTAVQVNFAPSTSVETISRGRRGRQGTRHEGVQPRRPPVGERPALNSITVAIDCPNPFLGMALRPCRVSASRSRPCLGPLQGGGSARQTAVVPRGGPRLRRADGVVERSHCHHGPRHGTVTRMGRDPPRLAEAEPQKAVLAGLGRAAAR